MASPTGRTFVVAVDSTDISKKRLEDFIAEFVVPGDQVHLAHVVPEAKETLTIGLSGAFSSTGFVSGETAQEQSERRVKLAKAQMRDIYVPILTAANIPYEVAILVTPSKTKAIGEVLTKYAANVKATALVLGKSDRTKVQQLFLGSVFKVVLDTTTTNILVVA